MNTSIKPHSIVSKLPQVGLTIFAQMTKLAMDNQAINLSQGFPDFDPDPDLIDLVHYFMKAGHNQYSPMQGVPVLRERIAEKTKLMYGADYNPETEIIVTAGATEALFIALTTAINPGDEVIIFEPAYDAYAPVVRLNGGIPCFISLKLPDYHIDWDEVSDRITAKTRMIILNSPHNPTGSIITKNDIDSLEHIISNTNILITSDEVYEHIIFDGLPHESMAKYPQLAERSFVISSFGKTYHTTGWKIGYCLAPGDLMAEFQKIRQFNTFATNTPMQYAYAEFLKKQVAYQNLSNFYQQKRDLFLSLMQSSRFKALPCNGTYFQMLDYSEISNEPDLAFSKNLTIGHKVASIPPSVFYHAKDDHHLLRFCFAKTDETLAKAAEILCQI